MKLGSCRCILKAEAEPATEVLDFFRSVGCSPCGVWGREYTNFGFEKESAWESVAMSLWDRQESLFFCQLLELQVNGRSELSSFMGKPFIVDLLSFFLFLTFGSGTLG